MKVRISVSQTRGCSYYSPGIPSIFFVSFVFFKCRTLIILLQMLFYLQHLNYTDCVDAHGFIDTLGERMFRFIRRLFVCSLCALRGLFFVFFVLHPLAVSMNHSSTQRQICAIGRDSWMAISSIVIPLLHSILTIVRSICSFFSISCLFCSIT